MHNRTPAARTLPQMIVGAWFTQGIYAAAELGIADALARGPLELAELALLTQARRDPLRRLLRALCAVGIFSLDREGRYTLTPLAELLRSDVDNSQRDLALMGGAEFYRSWGGLAESVRSGHPAFDETFGVAFFPYLQERPDRARIYDAAMTGIHGSETVPVLDAYSFASFRTVVDVGGGNGSQLAAILRRHPALTGVLFDQPSVAARARAALSDSDVGGRCRFEGGDFFTSVPRDADAYVLRHVVHDWEDDQAVTILRNCRDAMNPHGKVLLVETVIPDGDEPCFGKWLDLMMLLVGGRERTEDQYRQLLERAGLRLTRVVATTHEVSVIEGVCVAS